MGFFKQLKEAWLASVTFDKLDDEFYDQLEEALILADVGVDSATDAVAKLRKRVKERLLTRADEVKDALRAILAEKLEVSPAAVAVSLKKLEKSGHISRACDELDNRMNRVVITEKGKKAIEISHRYFGEIEDFLLQGFSCEEMEALSDYLKRIMKNGENYYDSLLK